MILFGGFVSVAPVRAGWVSQACFRAAVSLLVCRWAARLAAECVLAGRKSGAGHGGGEGGRYQKAWPKALASIGVVCSRAAGGSAVMVAAPSLVRGGQAVVDLACEDDGQLRGAEGSAQPVTEQAGLSTRVPLGLNRRAIATQEAVPRLCSTGRHGV